MPGEDIYSWSTVAADNGSADTLINWVEGQARASVNNSSRSEMAAHAKNRNLITGTIITTGTANAQAFLSGNSYTTIPLNMRVVLKAGPGLTNTASMTLSMDGLAATLVVEPQGGNLRGHEFTAGDYVELLWNGSNWVFLYSYGFLFDQLHSGGGVVIGVQKFVASGIYTPTPQTQTIIVECIGGGGGGGGADPQAVAGFFGGGGGGAGGYSRQILTAAQFGASVAVTIGPGGVGSLSTQAAAGGTTSFGTMCIATGGGGGGASVGNVSGGLAGAGASTGGAVGDITAAGAPGGIGLYSLTAPPGAAVTGSGHGGSSAFGGGGAGVAGTNSIGNAGGHYGSGGSGAVSWFSGGSVTGGGSGSAGIVIVTEFAGRGAPGVDGLPGPTGAQGPAGPSGAGTGDVLRAGTPVAGQIAQWTDGNHITGVAATVAFTTGDAKITLKTVADTDWVMMNDGTIGSATSGASTRANADCQSLFTLIFGGIPDSYAPIADSAGVARTRAFYGNNAATAWAANARIALTRQLGRSLTIAGAGAGLTASVPGQYDGEETHTQTIAELAAHTHGPGLTNYFNMTDGSVFGITGGANAYYPTNISTVTGSTGSGTPMNIVHPRSFWNIMIKL